MDAIWTLAVLVVGAFAALWILAGAGLLVEGVLRRDPTARQRGWLYLGSGLGLLPFALTGLPFSLLGLPDEIVLLVLPGLAVSAVGNWLLSRVDKRRRQVEVAATGRAVRGS
ncbi:hypothetical protein ACQSSU_00225 [Micromonospora echinospora]